MAKSARDQRIDYVEFSVADIARSRDFYGKAFGWSFKDYGPSYCEFGDGRLTGGFALGGKDNPGGPIRAGGPLVILYADQLDETAAPRRGSGREDRQARLRLPGRPPLPLRRSGRLRAGGMVGKMKDRRRRRRTPASLPMDGAGRSETCSDSGLGACSGSRAGHGTGKSGRSRGTRRFAKASSVAIALFGPRP